MESSASKILSFDEFVSQKMSDETSGMEMPGAEGTPVPAQDPDGEGSPEHSLSLRMMDATDEPTDLDSENPEAKVNVEASADDVDAHTEDN
jgi:hypothetical protein